MFFFNDKLLLELKSCIFGFHKRLQQQRACEQAVVLGFGAFSNFYI